MNNIALNKQNINPANQQQTSQHKVSSLTTREQLKSKALKMAEKNPERSAIGKVGDAQMYYNFMTSVSEDEKEAVNTENGNLIVGEEDQNPKLAQALMEYKRLAFY